MNLYLVAKYGLCRLTSRNLENVKQKSPHLRRPLIKILIFSVVAGEGFEPPSSSGTYIKEVPLCVMIEAQILTSFLGFVFRGA
tara:strand:+ start:364 stop:612 length:249 start_codon:yes stop_codon:yes gene_type:complete